MPKIVSYYTPINDTSFELPVFWLSDKESRINELRFSDSVLLSFKTRLTPVTCFLPRHYVRLISNMEPERKNIMM